MARRRTIDPAFWQSNTVAMLNPAQRVFFIGLFSNADDEGWLKGDEIYLKTVIFPYDLDISPAILAEWRSVLVRRGFIKVHSKRGQKFIEIPKWESYQTVDHMRSSTIKPLFQSANGSSKHSRIIRDTLATHSQSPPSNSTVTVQNLTETEPKPKTKQPNDQTNSDAFRQLKRLWRRYGKGNLGSLGSRKTQWAMLVQSKGAEKLVAAGEIWARETGPNSEGLRFPLAHFLKNVEEYVEAAQDDTGHGREEVPTADSIREQAYKGREREHDKD